MRRTLLGAVALAASLGLAACSTNTPAHGASGNRQTTTATTNGTALQTPSVSSPSDQTTSQSIDGSSPSDVQTPDQTQPGNPCTLANNGAAFEADYGGKWTQDSPDNPTQSGPYKKRICVLDGMVPGAYSGTPGVPVPVTVAVVTYIDDINGTLFHKLVAKAKATSSYTTALPNNDGRPAGDSAFYDGQPGYRALTALDPLDHALIVQIVPLQDKYHVLVDDPSHDASLVSDMAYLMDKAAP